MAKKTISREYTELYKCYYCITKPVCDLTRLRECELRTERWTQSMYILPVLIILRDLNIQFLNYIRWTENSKNYYALRVDDVDIIASLEDESHISLKYNRKKFRTYNSNFLHGGMQGNILRKQNSYISNTAEMLKKDIVYMPKESDKYDVLSAKDT